MPRLLWSLACLLVAAGAAAQKPITGRQPLNVEADALRYDDLKQTSVFTGNVLLTRGGITIRGARMEVRQDAQGYQYGVVTAEPGQRAYFRQQREAAKDEAIEGESERIEYDGQNDVIKLIGRAELRRLRGARVVDVVSGEQIQYNSLTDVFTVDRGRQEGGPRVRATLTPQSDDTQAGAGQPGVKLRADEALGKRRP